ncbi:hypothetical protein BKA80DRAFT_346022 [Phyllosticta citrichinensis]
MASNGEIPEVIVKYHPYKVEGTDVAALRITCSHQKGEPWESLEVRVGKKVANQTSPQLLQQVAYCKGFYFDRQQALDHGWKFGRSGYRIPEQAKLFVKEAFNEHGRARAAVKVVDDLDSNSSESGSEATLGDENVANTFPAIQAQNMSTPIVQQMGNCPVVEGQLTSPRKPTNNSDESQCRRTCRKEEMGRSQEGSITKVDVQTDQDINTPQLFPNPFERSETDNVQEIGDFGFFIIQMVTVSGDYRRRGIAKTMYKHLIDAAMWRYPYMKFLVAWPLSMMDLGSPFNDMRAAGLDNDHQRHVAQLLTERLHLSMGFVPLAFAKETTKLVAFTGPASFEKLTILGTTTHSESSTTHEEPTISGEPTTYEIPSAHEEPATHDEFTFMEPATDGELTTSDKLANFNEFTAHGEFISPEEPDNQEYEAADRSLAAKLSLIDESREGRMYGVQPNDELVTVEEMLEEFD